MFGSFTEPVKCVLDEINVQCTLSVTVVEVEVGQRGPHGVEFWPDTLEYCPWVLQVISGHQGWVRCVDVEPGNEWFVTGSADRMIKVCWTAVLHFNQCYNV